MTSSQPKPDWSLFLPFAAMTLNGEGKSISVTITDPGRGQLDRCVYIWQSEDGHIARIGSSMHSVAGRLLRYTGDINRRLAGRPSSTTEDEASKWVALLQRSPLLGCVYQPPLVLTPFGEVRPYFEIERLLLKDYRGSVNRSFR